MRYRFTPNDNGQGLDSRSEAAQDPKLHKRYFAGYTGTAKNLFGKKTLSDFGDVGMRWGCTNCTNKFLDVSRCTNVMIAMIVTVNVSIVICSWRCR